MVSREREGRTVNRAGGGTTAVALAWGRDGGTRGGATQTGSQSMISAAATMAAEQDGGVGVGGLRTTAYTPSKRPPSRRVWRWRRWRGRRRPPPPMRPLCRLFPPQGARGSCAVATAGRAAAARSGHWGGGWGGGRGASGWTPAVSAAGKAQGWAGGRTPAATSRAASASTGEGARCGWNRFFSLFAWSFPGGRRAAKGEAGRRGGVFGQGFWVQCTSRRPFAAGGGPGVR